MRERPKTEAGRRLAVLVFNDEVIWEDQADAAASAIESEVLEAIEDHHPEIGSWVDDSTWLMCSCGWDSSEPKAEGWHQHLIRAIEAADSHRDSHGPVEPVDLSGPD